MSEEATIRRGVRNARYSTIPNHVFEDTRLSMEARWLLGYLLSKPDNWTVIVGDIAKKGGCGRDKARGIIKELVSIGYAEKEHPRDGGRFSKMSLVIYDEPTTGVAFLPQTEMPSTVNPSTVKPSTVNPTLVSTDDQKITENRVERGRASGNENREEVSKALERSFFVLVKGWPGNEGMPTGEALRLWCGLSDEQRAAAQAKRDQWLQVLRSQSRKHIPAPSTYVREKLWETLPDAAAKSKPSTLEARPFGKLWSAERLRLLLESPTGAFLRLTPFEQSMVAQGKLLESDLMRDKQSRTGWPVVNEMHSKARDRASSWVKSDIEDVAATLVPVKVGSDEWEAWEQEHKARGWPWLPDPGQQEWVYFPAGGPDALMGFEQGIRGNGNDGDR